MNPELRHTFNTISHNFETANQTAQENIYTFTQLYIDPCLSGVKECIQSCTVPCFPTAEENLRRKRGRSRGRAEDDFDFYDDWETEEEQGNTNAGWGSGELDSLLAGRSPQSSQPRRQRAMSYGARGRKGGIQQDQDQDPTIIPGSNYLGFLERLPFKIGTRVLRYQPSAANLQDHPGRLRIRDVEAEAVDEEEEEGYEGVFQKGHGRTRSDTTTSRSTTNSLSSRGDLIMSDEDEDAVPLDDEFAVMLGRRTTNIPSGEQNNDKSKSAKRPNGSRRTTRTVSSKSLSSNKSKRSSSGKSYGSLSQTIDQVINPSMSELINQEEQVRQEEELEIEQKREAAEKLAIAKGLNTPDRKKSSLDLKPNDHNESSDSRAPETSAISGYDDESSSYPEDSRDHPT